MKKTVLMLAAVTAASFGALAQSASAGPNIMCTLEEKGIYHSPLGSACHPNPWDPEQ